MKSRGYILLLILLIFLLYALVTKMQIDETDNIAPKTTEIEKSKTQSIKWVEVPIAVESEKEQPAKLEFTTQSQKFKEKRMPKGKEKAKVMDASGRNLPLLAPSKKDVSIDGATKDGKGNSQGNEGFNLLASYEIPVEKYLLMMRAKGARVVVYDTDREAVVCEVRGNALTDGAPDISNMSMRGRRITDDYPQSRQILIMAEKIHGSGSYDLILLLPQELDELIYNKVARIIAENGIKVNNVMSVMLEFLNEGGNYLNVRVKSVTGRFGTIQIDRDFKF